MTLQKAVSYFFNYLLLLPEVTFCWLAMHSFFRQNARKVHVYSVLASVLAAAAALAFSAAVTPLHPIMFVLLMTAVEYFVFWRITRLEWYKVLTLVLDATALLTVSSRFDRCIDVLVHPNGGLGDGSTYGLLLQWAFLLGMLFLLCKPLKTRYAWMLEKFHDRWAWCLASMVFAMIAVMDLMMTPQHNAYMLIGRIYSVSVLATGMLFFLLVFFNCVYFFIAHNLVKREEEERRCELLEVQAEEYRRLREHMQETARLRHDFRHTTGVLTALAEKGDLAGLRAYLQDYNAQIEMESVENFCKNSAVNAVLNYYAEIARHAEVSLRVTAALPAELPLSEADLCSMLGNLLENAVQAAAGVSPAKRQVRLAAKQDGGDLYVVLSNAYNGQLCPDGNGFCSTKHSGKGVGLSSVRSIVEKYHGQMRLRTDNGCFQADICLQP